MNSFIWLAFLLTRGVWVANSSKATLPTQQTETPLSPRCENHTIYEGRCDSNLTGVEVSENQTTEANGNSTTDLINDLGQPDRSSYNMFRVVFENYLNPVIDVIAIICSILTILVIHRSSLKSSSSVYIIGLTSSNLFFVILDVVFAAENYRSISSSIIWRNINSYLTAYVYWLNFVCIASNSWIILAFAIERLIAIMFPLKAHVVCRESRAKKIVIGIYLLAIICNAVQLFRLKVEVRIDPLTNTTRHIYTYTEFGLNPLNNQVWYLFYTISSICIPFPLLAILNALIIWKLRAAKKARLRLEEGTNSKVKTSNQVQIERILIGSIFAFLFCNALPASAGITTALYGSSLFRQFILEYRVRLITGQTILLLNQIINFLIYVFFSDSLRDSLKKMLKIKK